MQNRDLPLVSPTSPFRAKAIHAVRVGLVVLLLLAIPSPSAPTLSGDALHPPIELVQARLAAAESIEASINGRWTVKNATGDPVGEIARTLPDAQDVVGYRGPTETLIILTNDLKITSVGLLQSADTREHVDAVINDKEFFDQFKGWDWHSPPGGDEIDGVSGATLTSLALAEGVLKRMGGDVGSLVFAGDLAVDEVKDWFPEAQSLFSEGGFSVVKDSSGQTLGKVLRSGPHSDDVIGYQGPTELLMRIVGDDQVAEVRIRKSFDNEPYVEYVRKDKYSWSRLTGQTLPQLSELDPMEARIEGVSGATMTSLAVADTVIASAKNVMVLQVEAAKQEPTAWSTFCEILERVRWTSRDVATIAILFTAALFSHLKWFHHPLLRRIWLAGIVVLIGWWAGNLVSMALVAGWSAEGIAWQLAPGLATIAVVALAMPPLTKKNPYCNHLCPHGAVQQLIKPSNHSKRKWHLSPRVSRWLTKIPGATLVIAYLSLVMLPTIDLSCWEPFHAYLFRIAGWVSIALCALTLVLAAVVPMGYCRLGCPTGRMIDYLRRTAKSDRFDFADLVATALLVFAIATKYM